MGLGWVEGSRIGMLGRTSGGPFKLTLTEAVVKLLLSGHLGKGGEEGREKSGVQGGVGGARGRDEVCCVLAR